MTASFDTGSDSGDTGDFDVVTTDSDNGTGGTGGELAAWYRAVADDLLKQGLLSAEWWAAWRAVPATPFLSRSYERSPDQARAALTRVARMLGALGVDYDHSVLEIGTGTGFRTALLCERVGIDRVHSVDLDPGVVTEARTRLAAAGYPAGLSLAGTDGTFPGHDRLSDRVLVCRRVDPLPPAWVRRARPGGVVLAPVGNGVVRLVAGAHGASGRFLPGRRLTFRPVHSAQTLHALDAAAHAAAIAAPAIATGISDADAEILRDPDAWLWLQVMIPGLTRDRAGATVRVYLPDGSWLRLVGTTVYQGGPQRLWARILGQSRWWIDRGRPPRDHIGLSVSASGVRVWCDDPDQHAHGADGADGAHGAHRADGAGRTDDVRR